MQDQALDIWTVYAHPEDCPDKFVARLFKTTRHGTDATSNVLVADSLMELRQLLPPGLYRLSRWPEDEPQIIEVWL